VADGINPKAINNAYLRILKIDNTNLSVEYHNELYSIKEAELEGFKGTAIISDEYSLIVTVNDRKYLITIGESSKFGSYLSLYYGTQAIEISDGSFVKCN